MTRKNFLTSLFIFVFLYRFIIAFNFLNLMWPDEIFQTLEQAHRLIFHKGYLPWEFSEGVRNWIFPGFLSIFVYIGSFLGPGSWGYSLLIQAILCLFSLIPIFYTFQEITNRFGKYPGYLAIFIMGLFPFLVIAAPKAFNEFFAAHMFFAGLIIFENADPRDFKSIFLASFFIGLCFVLRIQYILCVPVVFIWYLLKKKVSFQGLFLGFISIVLFAGFLDYLTWKYPFQSFWLYYKKNIFEGLAINYAASPWHYYFQLFVTKFSYTLPFLLFLALIGCFQNLLPLLVLLTAFTPHLFIPHKEFRFIYLAVLMFIILMMLGTGYILSRWKNFKKVYIPLICIWIISLIYIQKLEMKSYLDSAGILHTYRTLSANDEICGLGQNTSWIITGGYYYLHKKIPIYEMDHEQKVSHPEKINYLMLRNQDLNKTIYPNFSLVSCMANVCVYKREGICSF